jgi:pyridoxal/pyridoxine/pyridoxamine kinase
VTLAVERKSYKEKYLKVKAPKIDRFFTGTGDIFSALNLIWLT